MRAMCDYQITFSHKRDPNIQNMLLAGKTNDHTTTPVQRPSPAKTRSKKGLPAIG